MSKVFAQLKPLYIDKITFIEADINIKNNYSLIDKYKITTIPTTLLLDGKGEVRQKYSGYIPKEEIQLMLDDLL